ncbi:hypothetical protein HHK36_028479 [Tetracentron sinense]|uniref:HTH myb-type domain-containing protein n=1 Tax=Tetracentron sinense TaxID=13715 RepID=A0A834YFT4_TETSI|nr:hypothetical protein HHK36_028479 [Tetracentron sinense]
MMERSPGCDDNGLKKGPWTPDEDDRLRDYIQIHGLANLPQLLAAANLSNLMSPWDNALRLQADATQLAKIQVLHNLLQIMNTSALPNMEAINLLGSAPFRDNQLNEYLGSNSQFEGLLNGLHGFYPNPTQIPSNFTNFGAPSDYQAIANSNVCFEGGPTPDVLNSNNHHFSGSYSDPTPITPIPALISASPEYSMVNQMESKINPTDISTHSTTSTTFEAWGELMDDDANESYWKDIL